jgi:hypothetical protein
MTANQLDTNQRALVSWKSFGCMMAAPLFARIIHVWLPWPPSWGIGMFVAGVVLYHAPPKLPGQRDVIGTLLASAGGGLVAMIGAYLLMR